jgi:lipopolysaccharide transport system ATP-binding protein
MSDTVIRVENLSKRYLVGHQVTQRERFPTFRDAIVRTARGFVRQAIQVLHGQQIVQGDEVEEFWALKDVSFEVKRGEVVGIIGRNGAGKSTLLKILSRITEPSEGRVTLQGRVASLLEVGTGFHQELSGRENIFLNGAILGMTREDIKKKFDEIVAFAGVDRFLDTPVKRYSSGMHVRLAFAVAAHLEPEILIVDEVLAVGDVEFQKKCLGKMSEIAGGGRTVLFVSHNNAAIRNLCSHGLVLREGQCGPKEDIISALNRYAAERNEKRTSFWTRPITMRPQAMQFETVKIELEGTQPRLFLRCHCNIRSRPDTRPAVLAIDIIDQTFVTIMQAHPRFDPFIGRDQKERLEATIELPPLVPGVYHLDFWMGPHNTETYDYIREVVSFEIIDSPSPERTYPHYVDHGSIVPNTVATVIKDGK